MDLEDGVEILKEHLPLTLKNYQKGLRHAIWILEEKLDEEERKRLNEDEWKMSQL